MDKYIEPLLDNYSHLRLGVSLLVTIFVIIITIVLSKLLYKEKISNYVTNTFFLMGAKGSGKTLIFKRLVNSPYINLQPSTRVNVGTFSLNGKSVRLVDIPGDEQQGQTFFDKYKSSMLGLVYVIDSAADVSEIKQTARYLYKLLSDPYMHKGVPILVLCNKQDQKIAKSVTCIQSILEKEIFVLDYVKLKDSIIENLMKGDALDVGTTWKCSSIMKKIEYADGFAFQFCYRSAPDLENLLKWFKKIDMVFTSNGNNE